MSLRPFVIAVTVRAAVIYSEAFDVVEARGGYCKHHVPRIKQQSIIMNQKVPVGESRKSVRKHEREVLEDGLQHENLSPQAVMPGDLSSHRLRPIGQLVTSNTYPLQ